MGHSFSLFLTHYGLLALFLLTLIKAIGVPLPIPADVVVLAAATGSAGGRFVPWQAFAVVLVPMVGGGFMQFLLARGPGRQALYRLGPRIGLTSERLDLAFERVEGVGVWGIAISVVTPGIRTAAIPACGLTTISSRIFLAGLTLGTTVYVAAQFLLAYGLAKFALRFWSVESHVPFLIALSLVVLLSGFVVFRHRTRHLAGLHGTIAEEDTVLRSHRCPLCWLTVASDIVAGRPRISVAGRAAVSDGQQKEGVRSTPVAIDVRTPKLERRH